MQIGCHVSIRHGYLGAAQAALAVSAGAFQYFPKNPRSLAVKRFNRQDAAACRQYCEEHGIISVAHTPYPTNLSVDDRQLYEQTVASVRNDLEIADACGSLGVVVHFGKYKGTATDPLFGYRAMIEMLDEILADWEGKALLLLENNAGQGGKMGTTFEELTQVRSLIRLPQKVGFCLDTCHLFASGVWNGENQDEMLSRAGELGYVDHLKVIHLNDSQYPSGSHRDRHASIGRGQIGENAIRALLTAPPLADLPVILETPVPDGGSHRDEIQYVKELIARGNDAG
ncbi:deoxyribonuclease IV [Brevibacillus humidisoli]|uniref:deoxyribonuclease IV n=1 Tax=Brevibacillus humidisoli TaxID=2895522 RepID=UPI001E4D5177|nr:deoxyribonuclease IV [Brevibacillus humidisoli]UFJ43037.1 deoxyribonuclease IV [Brevibacillus humidisoli]